MSAHQKGGSAWRVCAAGGAGARADYRSSCRCRHGPGQRIRRGVPHGMQRLNAGVRLRPAAAEAATSCQHENLQMACRPGEH